MTAGQGSDSGAETEARFTALVLDTVTSAHSRRVGLERFFVSCRVSGTPTFTKVLVGEYRTALLAAGLSRATLNLRLAPVRRLAARWPTTAC